MPLILKSLGRRFLIFGSFLLLGVFVLLFSLGSRDMETKKQESVEAIRKENREAIAQENIAVSKKENNDIPFFAAIEDPQNTTQKLAKEVATDILKRNPGGPGSLPLQKLSVSSPEEVAQKLESQALQDFNWKEFYPHVDVAKFHAVSDSESGFQNYFKNFSAILRRHFANLETNSADNFSAESLRMILATYIKTIDEFLKLEVPQSLILIHQKETGLLMGQRKVYETFALYEDDPVKSLLAAKAGEEIDAGFQTVKDEILSFIATHNLNI